MSDEPVAGEDPAVVVRDLRMRYGDNDVLTGLDFEVRRGEVLCLLGPNGAGKTTTIEILEGLRIRSAGEVSVLDRTRRGRTRTGGPAPASCCSRGATIPGGRRDGC